MKCTGVKKPDKLWCGPMRNRGATLELVNADITTLNVEAIVNAANSSLMGGGGVDGAIHHAAGPQLLEACQEIRCTQYPDGLPVGQAVATPGFNLPASFVIHTVGPNRYAGQSDPELLRQCFISSLSLADSLHVESVAFPAISAGVYGWDGEQVATIGLSAISDYLKKGGSGLERVVCCLFGPRSLHVWRHVRQQLTN